MLNLWNSIVGYAIIQLEAIGMERLLNLAVSRGIFFLSVERVSPTVCRVRMSYAAWCRFTKLKGNFRHTILQRGGLWGLFHRIRMRPLPGVFLLVALIGVCILSGMCLSLRIEGLESVSEYELRQTLEEGGIRPPFRKKETDLENARRLLTKEYPQLMYAHFSYSGVVLHLRVAEGDLPALPAKDAPQSLVAEKEGIVTRVVCLSGEAKVEPGSRVQAGDVLISGAYLSGETAFAVAAAGQVDALVEYSSLVRIPFSEGPLDTGRVTRGLGLRIGDKNWHIWGKDPYEHSCLEEERTNKGKIELYPVCWREQILLPTEKRLEHATIAAREQAYYEIMGRLPKEGSVREIRCFVTREPGSIAANALVMVEQPIGIKAPLIGEDAVIQKEGSQEDNE